MKRCALAARGFGSIFGACVLLLGCRPGTGASTAAPQRPKGPLSLDEARAYVLALVNRDRAEAGLEAVELDAVASRAAERHAEDMALHGFTAHWGSDGSVPEQRYSEAGGIHMAQENAACFFDAVERKVEHDPVFLAEQLEEIEHAFISEVPPNDGHRKNILKSVHNRVGVGLAQTVGLKQPCMAQEFVDDYGEYAALPAKAKPGATIHVAGEVHAPVEFGGVGIGRIDSQKPLSARHLNTTSSYRVPEPDVLYFPAGFKTPKPVKVNGKEFEIDVPLGARGKPGRYEVSVWGKYPGAGDTFVMVSLRVVKAGE